MGYPGTERKTAHGYATEVFSQTSPDERLGGYANLFMAFCYRTSPTADFTHIALPFTGALVAEANLWPLIGVMPASIVDQDASTLFGSSVGRLGAGFEITERFKQFARLWYLLRLMANMDPPISWLHVVPEDFSGDYVVEETEGDDIAFTGQVSALDFGNIYKIMDWGCSFSAMVQLIACITGRDYDFVWAEMMYVNTNLVQFQHWDDSSTLTIKPFQKLLADILHFAWISTASVFRFANAWGIIQTFMDRADVPGHMTSGVRVFDRQSVETPSYEKRYIPVALLDTFLETEAYQMEDLSTSMMHAVPTRRIY
jgi:hypothetical protein